MEKVLLDTDIGSDIDDAVALAYLLANPQCQLLGVTTVTGEPERRAAMASALCRVAGREVPIFPGAAQPLLVEQQQPHAPQAEALSRWPHRAQFPAGRAVAFLSETIRAHPGEVTLLAVGPLTNLGLLFRCDPQVAGLLKRLVLMCGLFSQRLPDVSPVEWNARGDPHATAIVYRAPVAEHRSLGLDVTCRVQLQADEVRRRFAATLLRPVLDFAEVWFRQRSSLTFHDPLAAVSVFDEQVCAFARGAVRVEVAAEYSAGRTLWQPGDDGPHRVAVEVDPEGFFRRFFEVFR